MATTTDDKDAMRGDVFIWRGGGRRKVHQKWRQAKVERTYFPPEQDILPASCGSVMCAGKERTY